MYDEIVAKEYPEPMALKLDLAKASDDDFQSMAQAIFEQLGRLDGILHNASRFDGLAPLEYQSLDQWMGTLRVNLAAPAALTRACLPLLTRAPDSAVLLTSETHGHQPMAFWGAFSVSKWALEGLVTIWAKELSAHPNLRMNVLIPGPVRAPQRLVSHPAEAQNTLPDPTRLMPLYLYLMGSDSRGHSGEIFEAQML